MFIYYGLCSAIGRLLGGIICNHRRVNPFFVFQAAEFVVGLSTILVTLATSYAPLVIYIIIYGLADGFFFNSLCVLLLVASPLKAAAVIGWEMMLVSFFLASGPPLAGEYLVVVPQQFSFLLFLFLLLLVLVLVLVLLVLLLLVLLVLLLKLTTTTTTTTTTKMMMTLLL